MFEFLKEKANTFYSVGEHVFLMLPEDVQIETLKGGKRVVSYVNELLSGLQPIQIVIITCVALCLWDYVVSVVKWIANLDMPKMKTKLFRFATFIPAVQAYLDKESTKVMTDCTDKFMKARKGQALDKLPVDGTSQTIILERL